MDKNQAWEEFSCEREESSLICLIEIVKKAKGGLRKFFRFYGVDHEDLTSRLMSRVNDFSYQDEVALKKIFSKAKFCQTVFDDEDQDVCFLAAILSTSESVACRVLESLNTDCEKMLAVLAKDYNFEKDIFNYSTILKGGRMSKQSRQEKKTSILADYGVDLTERYKKDKPEIFYGRNAQMSQMIRMLGKMKRNSVLILGNPGSGKTALVNEFAYRLANGQITGVLSGLSIFQLRLERVDHLPKTFYGMRDFFQKVVDLFPDSSKVIFFLDWEEVELNGNDSFATINVLNVLKQVFQESKVRFILIAYPDDYDSFVMDCQEAVGLVGILHLEEPSEQEAIEILNGTKSRYEQHHKVVFCEEAVKRVLERSKKIFDGTHLPGKALELMDDIGSHFSAKGVVEIKEEEVAIFCEKESQGSIVEVRSTSYDQRLADLPKNLKSMVIGQDQACQDTAEAVMALCDPEKPIASLFYAGPSGVGKTLLAQSLAKCLFDSSDNFVRLDMSEYQEGHEVAKLTGSPPGYVGYKDNNQLTDKVKKKQKMVILFDEIEKAHPSIYNIFLQILDHGILTDGEGEACSFKQTILIMTSNIDLKKGKKIGFGAEKPEAEKQMDFGKALQDNNFRREFVGRLDQIIGFNPLTKADFLRIIDLEISKISEAGKKRGLSELSFDLAAKEFLVAKSETSEYGARNLNKVLRRLVRVPLGRMLVENKTLPKVQVSATESGLVFA